MTDFQPTAEQQRALDLFATGETLAIEAGAGTGKTATLKLLAESTQRRGQYVAFNKAIVEEAKAKFPASVACNTAHSLAVRYCGSRFASRKNGAQGRMKSSDIAKILGLDAMTITLPDGQRKYLSPSFLAGVTMRAVTRFCQSADREPSRIHVPYIDGIDAMVDGKRGSENNRAIAKHVEPAIRRAWADWSNEAGTGRLSFTLTVFMSVCLKVAQLEGMTIGADFILFDECQDANPVLVAIVENQSSQVVWVGDSQQQIYSFTGAINALQRIQAEQRCFLTKSFRFGQEIADEANTILSWIQSAELRLTGNERFSSRVEALKFPDTILTRTNAQAFREVMEKMDAGQVPFLVGGGREIVSFAEAAQLLQDGQRTSHVELACFENWREVQQYVQDDEQGGELRLMVSLVDEFGAARIIEVLGSLAREEDADVVVSTAHKSKGREWVSVRLASDFADDREGLGDDEKRLLYVAVTRAQLFLDITQVAVLSPEYDSPEQAEERATRAEARRVAQEAAAARLAAKPEENGASGQEAVLVLEDGRREITGDVVSTKDQYGRKCILVKLNGHGVRAFGTCPAEIIEVERGARVRFTATFKRSNGDDQFGFFSHPTKAEVLV